MAASYRDIETLAGGSSVACREPLVLASADGTVLAPLDGSEDIILRSVPTSLIEDNRARGTPSAFVTTSDAIQDSLDRLRHRYMEASEPLQGQSLCVESIQVSKLAQSALSLRTSLKHPVESQTDVLKNTAAMSDMVTVLEVLGRAAIILSEHGRVLASSAWAGRVVAPLLQTMASSFSLRDKADDDVFKKAFAECLRASRFSSQAVDATITDRGNQLHLHLWSLDAIAPSISKSQAVLVILTQAKLRPEQIMARRFHLTKTETRIVQALFAGHTCASHCQIAQRQAGHDPYPTKSDILENVHGAAKPTGCALRKSPCAG